MFNRQINRKYRNLLKTLATSNCHSEILTGIRQLQDIQLNRCLNNFSQKKPNRSFDVNQILFKNPFYRQVIKELVIADTETNPSHWEQRLNYWEPLFYQFNDAIISDKILENY